MSTVYFAVLISVALVSTASRVAVAPSSWVACGRAFSASLMSWFTSLRSAFRLLITWLALRASAFCFLISSRAFFWSAGILSTNSARDMSMSWTISWPSTTPPAQLLATQNSPALSPKTEASQANQPSPARVEAIAEPSAAQRSSSRDIMVRIPDATDRGTNVRFVERGTEVHVSVRTGDVELAQMLRGGLSELTGDLQRSGIRAEVW